MSIFGELERFFSEIVYPVWPLFVALAFAAAAFAGYVAYRLGWHVAAMRHRFLTGAAVVVILAVAIPVGYYTISPLFERNTVCEASPLAEAGPGSVRCEDGPVVFNEDDTPPGPTSQPDRSDDEVSSGRVNGSSATPAPRESPTPDAFEPHIVTQGEFVGADDFHFGEGQALLIETAPGEYTLRFENFSVRNGPDLYVYLSPSADGYTDGALELGTLKGTDGAFNYEIPAETDVSQFQSVVVWCKAFTVLFAHATFE